MATTQGFSGVGMVSAYTRVSGSKGLGWMFGNCPKFELAPSTNAVERQSSMDVARSPLRRMTGQTQLAVTLVTDEFNKRNVALACQARIDEVAADAVTLVTKVFPTGAVVGDVLAGDDLNVNTVTVEDSTSGTAKVLVLGVNYSLDTFSNQVVLLDVTTGGAYVQPFKLKYKRGAVSIVSGLAVAASELWLSGALTYADDGQRGHLDVYRVRMDPASLLAYINADYNDFELKGTALLDPNKTPASVGGQIYRWALPSTHA